MAGIQLCKCQRQQQFCAEGRGWSLRSREQAHKLSLVEQLKNENRNTSEGMRTVRANSSSHQQLLVRDMSFLLKNHLKDFLTGGHITPSRTMPPAASSWWVQAGRALCQYLNPENLEDQNGKQQSSTEGLYQENKQGILQDGLQDGMKAAGLETWHPAASQHHCYSTEWSQCLLSYSCR